MSINHDIDGKESSKRKWAKVLVRSGLAMAWIAFALWVYVTIKNHKEGITIPMELIMTQLAAGLLALGFTLGERWNK